MISSRRWGRFSVGISVSLQSDGSRPDARWPSIDLAQGRASFSPCQRFLGRRQDNQVRASWAVSSQPVLAVPKLRSSTSDDVDEPGCAARERCAMTASPAWTSPTSTDSIHASGSFKANCRDAAVGIAMGQDASAGKKTAINVVRGRRRSQFLIRLAVFRDTRSIWKPLTSASSWHDGRLSAFQVTIVSGKLVAVHQRQLVRARSGSGHAG